MRLLLLLLLALGFCAPLAMGADEPPPKDWIKTDCGGFIIYLPPDMKVERLEGEDSAVRQFTNGSIGFTSDYGSWSNSLESFPRPVSPLIVDGKTARMVVSQSEGDSGFHVAIHFPETGRPGMMLTLDGGSKDKAGTETLQRIYKTVRFK